MPLNTIWHFNFNSEEIQTKNNQQYCTLFKSNIDQKLNFVCLKNNCIIFTCFLSTNNQKYYFKIWNPNTIQEFYHFDMTGWVLTAMAVIGILITWNTNIFSLALHFCADYTFGMMARIHISCFIRKTEKKLLGELF